MSAQLFVDAGLLPSPDEVHRVLAALRDGFFDVGEVIVNLEDLRPLFLKKANQVKFIDAGGPLDLLRVLRSYAEEAELYTHALASLRYLLEDEAVLQQLGEENLGGLILTAMHSMRDPLHSEMQKHALVCMKLLLGNHTFGEKMTDEDGLGITMQVVQQYASAVALQRQGADCLRQWLQLPWGNHPGQMVRAGMVQHLLLAFKHDSIFAGEERLRDSFAWLLHDLTFPPRSPDEPRKDVIDAIMGSGGLDLLVEALQRYPEHQEALGPIGPTITAEVMGRVLDSPSNQGFTLSSSPRSGGNAINFATQRLLRSPGSPTQSGEPRETITQAGFRVMRNRVRTNSQTSPAPSGSPLSSPKRETQCLLAGVGNYLEAAPGNDRLPPTAPAASPGGTVASPAASPRSTKSRPAALKTSPKMSPKSRRKSGSLLSPARSPA